MLTSLPRAFELQSWARAVVKAPLPDADGPAAGEYTATAQPPDETPEVPNETAASPAEAPGGPAAIDGARLSKVLDFVRGQGGAVKARDIIRAGLDGFGVTAVAEKAFDQLAAAGLGAWVASGN
jgi:hypothetical protein